MGPPEEILRGAKAGNVAAIECLGHWLRQLLLRSFSRHFGQDVVEDLAHDTIVDVLAALDRAPDCPREFTLWVHGFGRNERRERRAAERREIEHGNLRTSYAQTLPPLPSIDAMFAAEEKRRLLMKLIDELKPQPRHVYLARLAGHSFAEIAEGLNIPETTARTCAGRARRQVGARWEIARRTPLPFRTPPKRA